MVILRPLLHHDFRATLPPIRDAVQWSGDNQVSVITRQGIVVFELTADPGFNSDNDFYIARSNLSTPRTLPKVDTGWNYEAIFSNRKKDEVFELVLDRVLTPRGVHGIEFDNHFVRADWSKNELDTAAPFYKPKCLLAGLTSCYQLKIYDTLDRQHQRTDPILSHGGDQGTAGSRKETGADGEDDGEEEEVMMNSVDEWVQVLDISVEYHKYVKSKWEKLPFSHSEYKKRLYQVAIVDFSWIQPWDSGDTRLSNLMTFHGNGDVVFWSIIIHDDCHLSSERLFHMNLHPDGVVTRNKFYQLSPEVGILGVAFVNGIVKICVVERTEENAFAMSTVEQVWEEDQVAVEFIEFTDQRLEGKVTVLSLIIVKHPNVLISFNIRVESGPRLAWEEVSMLESPDGHVVGFCSSQDRFVLQHENGVVSYVRLEDGVIQYESDVGVIIEPALDEEEPEHGDYIDSHKIHSSQDPLYASLWTYYGFGLSPNGVLACSLKALQYSHDSIIVKESSACTFMSLFPQEDAWPTVREVYEQRGLAIQSIVDCLHGFRYQLRAMRDYNFRSYFNPDQLETMSMNELKLYIWVLRAMGLPKPWIVPKSFSSDDIEQISLDVLRATTLAQERLIERRLTQLILKLYECRGSSLLENKINVTSWNTLIKYLRSKPNCEIPPELALVEGEEKSICSSCDMEIDYSYNKNYDPATRMTHPGIPGYKWNGKTCVNQHKNPVCILSLVSLSYPHRLCPNCGCAALLRPAFDQLPECPFCEEYMKFEPERWVGL